MIARSAWGKLIAVPAVLSLASKASAGALGMQSGEKPARYGCAAVPSNPGFDGCPPPPKPHSAFEDYVVKASEQVGICWIKGIGKDISDNGYGVGTRSVVVDLKSQLAKKYGAGPEKTDFPLPGSIWKDPDDCLMAYWVH